MVTDERALLRAALIDRAVRLGEGWRTDGGRFGWLLDCREVLLSGDLLSSVGRLVWALVSDLRPVAVAGSGVSAAPLVSAVVGEAWARGSRCDGLLVRPEAKAYGRRRQVEGPLPPPGSRVVVLDDLVSSGDTLRWVADVLRGHGLLPVGAAVLVDFDRSPPPAGLSWRSLFSLSELGLVPLRASEPPRLGTTWELAGIGTGPDDVPLARPLCCGDLVVTATNDGDLVATAAESGRVRWRRRIGTDGVRRPTHCSPAATVAGIGVGDDLGAVTCIDPGSGATRWRTTVADRVGAGVAALADGGVVVPANEGADGGRLVCLAAGSGARRWEVVLRGHAHSRPVVVCGGDIVVAADNAGWLTAVSVSDGAVRWRVSSGSPVKADLAVGDGVCFAAGFDGTLTAIDPRTGTLAWRRRLARRLYATPRPVRDAVVVGGEEHLVGLDRQGGTVWIAPVGGTDVRGEIARLADGTFVCATRDGAVCAVSAGGGPVGRFSGAGGATAGIVAAGARQVLALFGDSTLRALALP